MIENGLAPATPAVGAPEDRRTPAVHRFGTPERFIAALRRVPDCYDPHSSSVLSTRRRGGKSDADAFPPSFFDTFEERAQVMRLLALLDARSRTLLVLWFVEGRPVVSISRRLRISRVHCYRLKDKALRTILDADTATAAATPVDTAQRKLAAAGPGRGATP